MTAQHTRWQIGESGPSVTLDDRGRGEVTFTVTNVGGSQDRSMLTITPLDGAAAGWFEVEEPQRLVAPGASVVYPVEIAVPPDVPAGTYGLQAVAFSADTDPLASSVSSRRISVVLTREAQRRRAPRWLWVVIAAVVLVLLIVVLIII
jgi:predicted nucleic acid-binding Zn ribbon protein